MRRLVLKGASLMLARDAPRKAYIQIEATEKCYMHPKINKNNHILKLQWIPLLYHNFFVTDYVINVEVAVYSNI
jgi:hypothetical protein